MYNLEEIDISVRCYNVLKSLDIDDLTELSELSEDKLRCYGRGIIEEIKTILKEKDLYLSSN